MNNQKSHPILYSAPMVRARRAGIKNKTRRSVNDDWQHFAEVCQMPESIECASGKSMLFPGRTSASFIFHNGIPIRDGEWQPVQCPYGRPGDLLWKKETFFAWGRWETRHSAKKGRDEWHFVDMTLECGHAYMYAADGQQPDKLGVKRSGGVTPQWWRRPAIFMPKVASRGLDEIVSVRAERLQDISEEDAIAEGIRQMRDGSGCWVGAEGHGKMVTPWLTAKAAYFNLWESLNGAESLAANPWVWVVNFKVLK